MKKGIVMEQHRKYTIILTEEGTFEKSLPIREAEIGMEVLFEPLPIRKGAKQKKVPLSILAVASIFLLIFTFLPGNSTTYAYVVVDINPSVELEVADNLTVQSVRPINQDAKVIIGQLNNLENQKVDIAIDMIIDKSEEYGMINQQRNMLVGVSYVDGITKDSAIPNPIEQYLETKSEWNVASFHVPKDLRDEAVKSDASMNEILAAKMEGEGEHSNADHHLDDQEKAIIHSFYKNKDKNDYSEDDVIPASYENQELKDEVQEKDLHINKDEPQSTETTINNPSESDELSPGNEEVIEANKRISIPVEKENELEENIEKNTPYEKENKETKSTDINGSTEDSGEIDDFPND